MAADLCTKNRNLNCSAGNMKMPQQYRVNLTTKSKNIMTFNALNLCPYFRQTTDFVRFSRVAAGCRGALPTGLSTDFVDICEDAAIERRYLTGRRAGRPRRGAGRARPRGDPRSAGDAAAIARCLPNAEREGRRALRRQGAQPQGAGRQLHAFHGAAAPAPAHGRRDAQARSHPDPHRGRGAAARKQPHQAPRAALQHHPPGRQIVPVHPSHRRHRFSAADQASRGAERAPAIISARSPRRARSIAR